MIMENYRPVWQVMSYIINAAGKDSSILYKNWKLVFIKDPRNEVERKVMNLQKIYWQICSIWNKIPRSAEHLFKAKNKERQNIPFYETCICLICNHMNWIAEATEAMNWISKAKIPKLEYFMWKLDWSFTDFPLLRINALNENLKRNFKTLPLSDHT